MTVRVRDESTEESEGTFEGKRCVDYLYCNDDFMDVYIYQYVT